jgi:hypothetical protein
MVKRKKSFYLRIQCVRRLNGFEFWRLSIYKKSRMVKTIGYFDHCHNLLFLNFNELFYYMTYGLDFKNRFDHNYGKHLKPYNLGIVILLGLYSWFSCNEIRLLTIPKRFWLPFFKRTLKVIYYCLFRNLMLLSNYKLSVAGGGFSKIINKRLVVVNKLSIIN